MGQLDQPMSRSQQTQSIEWLKEFVLPLWMDQGIDRRNGGFHESLNLSTGTPEMGPRRAMVQARQIYSLRVALALGIGSPDDVRPIIVTGAKNLVKTYQQPSGSFLHSVDASGQPHNSTPELYTQAFALFGLAHAFSVEPLPEFKNAALKLMEYLSRERKIAAGGFSELQNGAIVFQSNPHMHLFEAAIAWTEADTDLIWKSLAGETLDLCLNHFIDSQTGLLAEHFDSKWNILKEGERFFFEPGHQYEWSWLMGRYQNASGRDLTSVRLKLFENAEMAERHPIYKSVYDQVWSDFSVKSHTARFWPQCERIKCAAQLAHAASATEAMQALLQYFETPVKGLWYDIREESGEFKSQPAKASSLYHIIGAIAEFEKLRN